MGQGLESSPYPHRTTARARRPVLSALTAHNGFAHGGRLTAGCPAFSVITAPLPFRDDRAITRSPKCRAAGAIAPRPAHRRERGSGWPPPGHHARNWWAVTRRQRPTGGGELISKENG